MLASAPFYEGITIGLGLIVAIGAQNAFVIKQGLLKNHVFLISTTCFLIDAICITAGVLGLGAMISSSKPLLLVAKYGGALFLFCYSAKSFIAAFSTGILHVSNENTNLSFGNALVAVLAVSLLNPHLYLDTCFLIGTIGSQFSGDDRLYFAAGAVLASFIWFFSIGYGARFLLPIFQNPISWKILDFLIGVMMFTIAASLLIWDFV